MKYTITINQAGIADAGFADKTDLIDWAIIEYIMAWQAHPKASRMGDRVWINYRHLIDEMPLLGLNSKQAVSKRVQKLHQLDLISIDHDSDGRLFAALTMDAHNAINFKMDGQPNVGGVNHGGRGVNCGGQGPVNHGGHTADNNISADNQDSMQVEDFWKIYPKQRAGSMEKARLAFQKAVQRGNSATEIIAAARAYAASREVRAGYAKGAAAWLNDDRFLSDYSQKGQSNGPGRDKNNGDYTNGTMATQALADIAREALLAESGYDWEAHNTRQGRAAWPHAGFGGIDGTFTHGAASGHPGANFEDADAKQKSGRLAGGDADADCRHR